MSSCCFTGHRPNKLKGYNPKDNSELLWSLYEKVGGLIENKAVDTFYTGMALGVDQWAARIVLRYKRQGFPNIKLICAIPCKNQHSKWPEDSRKEWQSIVDKADSVVYVSEEEYTPYCMDVRNKYMVDNSTYVIGVWNGTKGGTNNCITYAKKKDREIFYINPLDYRD